MKMKAQEHETIQPSLFLLLSWLLILSQKHWSFSIQKSLTHRCTVLNIPLTKCDHLAKIRVVSSIKKSIIAIPSHCKCKNVLNIIKLQKTSVHMAQKNPPTDIKCSPGSRSSPSPHPPYYFLQKKKKKKILSRYLQF